MKCLAGIIAGRIKEKYHHPTIVFTEPEPGVIKGSGRSIESYNMFLELMKCKDLMMRFGGHKMAAGMTLKKENLDELRRRLNEESTLSAKDFCPEVRIDAAMPIGYVTERLMEELEQMEPFGTGNPKPVFAEQHFKVLSGRVIGKEENMLKLRVKNTRGSVCDALLFRGKEEFEELVRNEFGQGELDRMYQGRENDLDVAFTYYPGINEYQGRKSVQMQVTGLLPDWRKKMIQISLCMIVKNEEAVLARCLDSIKELMDEIIIVDTGSTDRTKEIAAGYTVRFMILPGWMTLRQPEILPFPKRPSHTFIQRMRMKLYRRKIRQRFRQLKEVLLPEIDIVQMKYGNQLEHGTAYNYDEEYRPKLF